MPSTPLRQVENNGLETSLNRAFGFISPIEYKTGCKGLASLSNCFSASTLGKLKIGFLKARL